MITKHTNIIFHVCNSICYFGHSWSSNYIFCVWSICA